MWCEAPRRIAFFMESSTTPDRRPLQHKDVDVTVEEASVVISNDVTTEDGDTIPKGVAAATGEPFGEGVVARGSSPVVVWLVKLCSRGCSDTGEDDKDLVLMHAGAFPLATSGW